MKKITALILTFCIVLTLCGCGGQEQSINPETVQGAESSIAAIQEQPKKPQAVQNVENLIDSIGEIQFNSKNAITKAEDEYRYLREEEKSLVSNYGDLLRARDQYTIFMKEILLGTWKSEAWVDDKSISWDETFIFNEGGGGFFSDYNYEKESVSNSGSMKWEQNENLVMCELSTVFFGIVPYTLELREIEGTYGLIRTTAKGQEIIHWKQ